MPACVTTAALIVADVAIAGTVVACAARAGWPFELASHFRAQYAGVLCLSAIVLAFAHHWPASLLALSVALLNVVCIVPLYRGAPSPSSGRTGRVLLANVWSHNRAYDRLRRLIRDVDPDLIVLEEVTDEWLAALRDCAAAYPFSKSVLLEGGFGILLLSRLPVERAEVACVGGIGLPSIIARVQLQGQSLTVVATHPLSPIRPGRSRGRNRQLAALARFVRSQVGPLMLVGDLNTTSWSPVLQQMLRTTSLRDSRVRFGIQPTWPAPLPLLRIPIDHCLVTPEIVVHQRRVGANIGSDHFPVIIDFSLTA